MIILIFSPVPLLRCTGLRGLVQQQVGLRGGRTEGSWLLLQVSLSWVWSEGPPQQHRLHGMSSQVNSIGNKVHTICREEIKYTFTCRMMGDLYNALDWVKLTSVGVGLLLVFGVLLTSCLITSWPLRHRNNNQSKPVMVRGYWRTSTWTAIFIIIYIL